MKILHKISLILTIPMLLSGCLLNRLNTYELIGIADAVSHIAKNTVNAVDNLIGDSSSNSSSNTSNNTSSSYEESSGSSSQSRYEERPTVQKANLAQLKATFDNLIASKGKISYHQEVYLNYNLDTDDKIHTKLFDLCRLGNHLFSSDGSMETTYKDINKRKKQAKTASKVVRALEPEALYAILNNYLDYNIYEFGELAILNLYSSKPIPYLINVDSKNRIFFADGDTAIAENNNQKVYRYQLRLVSKNFNTNSKVLGTKFFDRSKNNCIIDSRVNEIGDTNFGGDE